MIKKSPFNLSAEDPLKKNILKLESLLSFKNVFTVLNVKFWNDAPNLLIF